MDDAIITHYFLGLPFAKNKTRVSQKFFQKTTEKFFVTLPCFIFFSMLKMTQRGAKGKSRLEVPNRPPSFHFSMENRSLLSAYGKDTKGFCKISRLEDCRILTLQFALYSRSPEGKTLVTGSW